MTQRAYPYGAVNFLASIDSIVLNGFLDGSGLTIENVLPCIKSLTGIGSTNAMCRVSTTSAM